MAESDLADTFRRLIANSGPISLMQFMGESNAHYYNHAEALGAEGDFITAPEISQMFGELIGLWLADMWDRAEKPANVHYVELGPGRGYLARDALRAMQKAELYPRAHLVEGSARLRDMQLSQLPEAIFHNDLSSVPMDGPILLVANEFLDALPVRQLVMTANGWREMAVDLAEDGEGFRLVAGTTPMDAAVPEARRQAETGTVIETCPGAAAVMFEVAGRLMKQGGAAVFIDYGHVAPRLGSTLQAISKHQKVDPLQSPGSADLTCHVDFDMMKQIALSRDARWMGTTTQGAWLNALGIQHRAQALAQASPDQGEVLARTVHRLTAADQMGDLFKVMGLSGPDWPQGAGLAG